MVASQSDQVRKKKPKTYQVLDNVSVKTSNHDTEVCSQDQEGGVEDKDEGLFAVELGDQDFEDGLDLAEELFVDADLDIGLCRASGGASSSELGRGEVLAVALKGLFRSGLQDSGLFGRLDLGLKGTLDLFIR